MYEKEIASLFNSEVITNVCRSIDNKHPRTKELRESLLVMIRNSVDLSNRHSYIRPYRQAYQRVYNDLAA